MKPKPEKTIEERIDRILSRAEGKYFGDDKALNREIREETTGEMIDLISDILCEIVGGDEEIEWDKDIVEQPKEAMEELVKIGRQELRREIRRQARKMGLEL